MIDPRTVVYLDLTGSGVETIAHLRQNGRITLLFCAFEGPPRLVRLYGRGRVVPAGTADAVATPGAEALVGRLLEAHPELVEPVEWLAEAVVVLATCDPRTCTGRVLYSGPFLEEVGRKPSVPVATGDPSR